MKFENSVVVITGGSRGIGKGLVRGFAKEGAKVYFTYLKQSKAVDELMEEANQNGWKVFAKRVDSTNKREVELFIENIDKIDVFINNAGIIKDQLVSLMTEDQWNDVIDTNLNGCFYYLKAVSRKMLECHSGNIINMSSFSGLRGIKGQGNYCASKAAIIAITKTLSLELAPKKIRVNAIAPGYINTEMIASLSKPMQDKYLKSIPLKRLGEVEDIVHLAMFLASEDSSYITGQCISIDGGISV